MNNPLYHHTGMIIDCAQDLLGNSAPPLNDKQAAFVKKILANAELFIHLYAEFSTAPIEHITAEMRHELGNPLTPINGYSELLLMGVIGTLTDKQQAHLQTIFDSTQALCDAVEDIVSTAREHAALAAQ